MEGDPDVVGVVLAGGGATRLGAVAAAGKASLALDGRTFLERVCGAIAAEVSRVVVVAAPGQHLPHVPQTHVVRDAMPGAGPLPAIRDGLRAAVAAGGARPPRRAVVASCDVPLLRGDVVRFLVEAARPMPGVAEALWTVPVVHGHRQVLLSVIDMRLLPRLESWIAAGRRDPRGLVSSMLDEDASTVRFVDERLLAAVDPTLASFVDVDTPEDLRRLETR